MPAPSSLDGDQPTRLDGIAAAFAQLDPTRRADLVEFAVELLEQQKGELQ